MALVRLLLPAALVVAVVAGAACADGVTDPPTAPSQSVTPFIVSSPAPHAGSGAPNYFGVWTGTMQLTDCRAAPPSVCKVSPAPRDIRLVVEQQGISLVGVFSMNEPGGAAWPFVGYVTAAGGIAGTATIDGASRVLVRLAGAGVRPAGEISDETATDGRLTFTRHHVVSTPLARVGPTL